MLLTEAIRTFNKIKHGVYTRLIYSTNVPIKSKYQNNLVITKYCSTIARFGINYGNLSSVRAKDETHVPVKKSNKEWILKNIIEYNKNTDKFYLNVYTAKNNFKPRYFYLVSGMGVANKMVKDLNEYKEYIQDSYLNKKCSSFEGFYKINLDNVHRIG